MKTLLNKSKYARRQKKAGFTLIEVVAATFIAIIGLGGAMSIGIWQLKATQFNQRSSEASAAAQQKLEELARVDYDLLDSGSSADGLFNLNWSVVTSNRCKLVSLQVSWPVGDSTQQILLSDLFPDSQTTGYIITN